MLCALMSLATATLVTGRAGDPRRLAGAMACAVVATYSFAAGLMLWVSQLPAVWLTGGARRRVYAAVWLAVGAAVYASYFYHFERPYQAPIRSNFTSTAAIKALVTYVFTYVGTPVGAYGQTAAAVSGGVGMVLFATLLFRLRALLRDPAYLLPASIGLQTLATASVSALGRAFFGVEQAMSSRYTTLSLPLWCAIVFLATLWWKTLPTTAPWRWRALRAVTAAIVAAVLTLSYARSARGGVYIVAARAEVIMYARRALLSGGSNALLLNLFPVLSIVRERRAILMRRQLSVFRPAAQPSYPLPGPE
jgi:hypothetical protein